MSKLTKERLDELIDFSQSPCVWRKQTGSAGAKGKIVGWMGVSGYRQTCVDGETHYVHRLVWFREHGVFPKYLDHVNGVRDDNRLENLVEVFEQGGTRNLHKRGPRALTREYLDGIIDFSQNPPVWKVQKALRSKKGDVIGHLDYQGYMKVKIDNKVYAVHRLVYFHTHGIFPSEIDHINGIRDDNRIENLRAATRFINTQNAHKPRVDNKHGARGVSRAKNGRYRAVIFTKGKTIHLGYFDTLEEASAAYLTAKKQYHATAFVTDE